VSTRIRIDLAYDGSGFSGWAKQPGRPSILASLEEAMCLVLRCDTKDLTIVVAGRTDAGVHAIGQVCHVDISDQVTTPVDNEGYERLTRRFNGALGHSGRILIHRVSRAPDSFDARFSPLARHYSYYIADGSTTKDPRKRNHEVWLGEILDVGLMADLGQRLLGLHDWASFCRARVGATTIRELQVFSWERDETGLAIGRVVADAFCHSMVRSLVGAAVAVGSGRCTIDEVVAARDARARTSLWRTMPAHGLTLDRVVYPPDSELAARQRATRDRRDRAPD
jgi:tRNA pseudouridine38-40 synthase